MSVTSSEKPIIIRDWIKMDVIRSSGTRNKYYILTKVPKCNEKKIYRAVYGKKKVMTEASRLFGSPAEFYVFSHRVIHNTYQATRSPINKKRKVEETEQPIFKKPSTSINQIAKKDIQ